MSKLDDVRKEINKIDEEMAGLFEKRMKLVEEVIDYKIENNMEILDSNRENMVVNKNLEFIENEDLKKYYIEFITNVMRVSKEYQKEILKK